mmetsp:Transcript_5552/g.8556  ORF Transcript_5552/g.8556 Transcript_5552/m.8556 type:complete len:210 (+) Transcript_5552:1205-1834(+)
MSSRSSTSGSFTKTALSNLPGLKNAVSTIHGVFVAARTTIRPLAERVFGLSSKLHLATSSMHWSNVLASCPKTTLLPPRSPNNAWNSSMNTTEGAFDRATANADTINFSLLPTSGLTMSLALRDIKDPVLSRSLFLLPYLRSVIATAFASNVFPVPGGPYRRTPVGGRSPNDANKLLLLASKANASSKASLASKLPPTDDKVDAVSSRL